MSEDHSRRSFLKTASVVAVGASLGESVVSAQAAPINIAPLKGMLVTNTAINTVEVNNVIGRLSGQLALLNDVALNQSIWNVTGKTLGYGDPVGCATDQFSDMALSIGTYCSGNAGGHCETHGCRNDSCNSFDCGNNHCNGQACGNRTGGCTNLTDDFTVNLTAWQSFKNTLLSMINTNPQQQFVIKLNYRTYNYQY